MDMTKMIIDAFMNPLYNGGPQGTLLESIRMFEERLTDYAVKNPASMDPVGDGGFRDEYNQLYMAVMNGNHDYGLSSHEEKPEAYSYAAQQKLPTVHEFLDSYRMVYETSVRPNKRPLTDAAYQALFDVENRTDDVIEAQIIIEKEGLLLNTVTADFKAVAEDFMSAVDPNYEVTSATTNATLGTYATAKSIEEITYMGEVAKATCDDIAVQVKLKVEMMQVLMSLIFAWEHSKRKIREGESMEASAQAMVLTRRQIRNYYEFLSEDMGLTWDVIENTPFYKILQLDPKGLDELWRLKKVMHPANIQAAKYALLEEILTDKSMEEILMTPQTYPYYELPDSNIYPAIDAEYEALAEELNKDIKYFQVNRRQGVMSQEQLLDKSNRLALSIADNNNDMQTTSIPKDEMAAQSVPETFDTGIKKEMGQGLLKGVAKEVTKETGKRLLRDLFRR